MGIVTVDSARITNRGQIMLPRDIRELLGVKAGDIVTLVCRDDHVVMMNPAVYAMKTLEEAVNAGAEIGPAPPHPSRIDK
jgi:AbrB family looped-hinge helix DNA binding protein